VNYRREYANRAVDPLSAIYLDFTGIRGYPGAPGGSAATAPGLQGRYGGYQFYNPSPLNGRTTATEGYVELGIPLLKNLPLVKDLDATLAGRLTDYSQSGDQKMSKLGLNWALNDMVRVRATVSADTRAPSVLELFSTAQVTQGRNAAPCSVCVGSVRTSGQNITTGNPALDPERATHSFFQLPTWVEICRVQRNFSIGSLVDDLSTYIHAYRDKTGGKTE